MKIRLLHNDSFAFGLMLLSIALFANGAFAQSSSFTYQGRLTDGGTAANGNYDLQFALFDSVSSGNQVGSTQTLNTVAVSNGVFTVSLDFGANAFPGTNRFLEIRARAAGAASFTTLTPRQPITSIPYAVRSLNAASADSVPASGVPAGSGNYIQNSSSPQSLSNFNISGNGTASGTLSGNVVNATTQFNLNGNRILSNPGINNLFAGAGTGASNTGVGNSFFGSGAGAVNTEGSFNTFVGLLAGQANTSARENAFFGASAGRANTTGDINSFFGARAGESNTSGRQNSFFGFAAGIANTTGLGNSFFGVSAGASNLSGNFNSFFGDAAGNRNSSGINNAFFGASAGFFATGNSNTFVGVNADFAIVQDMSPSGNKNTLLGAAAALGSSGTFSPENATAIGARARVDTSNSLVLGSINGINGAAADTNVGIGTTAPTARLHVVGTTALIGNVGIGGFPPQATLHVVGNLIVSNDVQIGVLRSGGATQLCRNASNQISTCSSSLRYKTKVEPYLGGLNIINSLRPISFVWKADRRRDIGLAAEEVAQVEPLLSFKNKDGEIEGVNYSQLTAVLINAVKELEAENEQLRKDQQVKIAALQQVNSALNARLHKVEKVLQTKSRLFRRK